MFNILVEHYRESNLKNLNTESLMNYQRQLLDWPDFADAQERSFRMSAANDMLVLLNDMPSQPAHFEKIGL